MKSQRTEYYPPALRLGYVFVNLDMKVYTVHYGEGLIVRLDAQNFTRNIIGWPHSLPSQTLRWKIGMNLCFPAASRQQGGAKYLRGERRELPSKSANLILTSSDVLH